MPLVPRPQLLETRDGIRLHALVWQSDAAREAPVVMLHGGGANAHWWDPLAQALSIHHPVFALDFRGHGDSDYPQSRQVGAFNEDLESLVGWLGREDVILIGHSMGAAVALDHACRFPATGALVLVDLARGGNPAVGRRARLALTLRRTYRTRAEAIDRFRFLPESSHASEALRAGLPSRPRPDLAALRCPTLLVRGCESLLLTRDAALAFIDDAPTARLVEIADSGHHVLIDQPERLLATIESFFATLPGAACAGSRNPAPPATTT